MIYPGAVWMPGANADYQSGQSQMRACVCHYTVGVNSTPVGLRGYFNFLVKRDGTVEQYAQANAVTWHAGEWNNQGPGIEVEYFPARDDAIFTDAARAACGELVKWVAAQGIPLVYYDGDRVAAGTYAGFISHRSLIQTDQHTDYWPQEDWDAMIATHREDDVTDYFTVDGANNYKHVPGVGMVFALKATNNDGSFASFTQTWISQADFDQMNTVAASGGGPSSAIGQVTGTLTIGP